MIECLCYYLLNYAIHKCYNKFSCNELDSIVINNLPVSHYCEKKLL